jgi:hypothetical protein
MEKNISVRLVLIQNEALQKEIRYSKIKTLIELIASTIMLFSFFVIINIIYRGDIPRHILMIGPIVAILNAWSWVTWWSFNYALSHKLLSFEPDPMFNYEDIEYRAIFEQYQVGIFMLKRLRRIELFVELLVSMQFISFGLLLAYSFSPFRWRLF